MLVVLRRGRLSLVLAQDLLLAVLGLALVPAVLPVRAHPFLHLVDPLET